MPDDAGDFEHQRSKDDLGRTWHIRRPPERFDVTVLDHDGNTVRRFRNVTYLTYLQVRQAYIGDPAMIVILERA